MSRQYEEYKEGKFKIYGEEREIIEPSNLKELMAAIQIRDEIQNHINGLMHDDDSSVWENLLKEQVECIQGYVENLEEFDNSHFVGNLNYLLKKCGLRMGELESLLEISAGYISRTVKENSNKRISIDVLWKIAKLFEVDLRLLLETDMDVPDNNVEIIIQFLQKLLRQTESYELESEVFGGIEYDINPTIQKTNLFEEYDERYIYHPQHLNPKCKFILNDDIVGFPNFKGDRVLAIIPFTAELSGYVQYDFILVDKDGTWDRVFYTSDTPFYNLNDHAKLLYDAIRSQEFDVKLAPEIKNMMTNFLN